MKKKDIEWKNLSNHIQKWLSHLHHFSEDLIEHFSFSYYYHFLCVVLKKISCEERKKMIKKVNDSRFFWKLDTIQAGTHKCRPSRMLLEQNRKSNFPLVVGGDLPSFFPGSL